MDHSGKWLWLIFMGLIMLYLLSFYYLFLGLCVCATFAWRALKIYRACCTVVGNGPLWKRLKAKQMVYGDYVVMAFRRIIHTEPQDEEVAWLQSACGDHDTPIQQLLQVLSRALEAVILLTCWPFLLLGDLLLVQPLRGLMRSGFFRTDMP